MAEGQSSEPASANPVALSTGKGTDTTLAVGLSSLIVFLANRSESQWLREVLGFAAPSIGLAVTYLARLGKKHLFHWRGNKQIKEWIAELVAERPKANAVRRAVIDSDLAEYRLLLKQRRIENLP